MKPVFDGGVFRIVDFLQAITLGTGFLFFIDLRHSLQGRHFIGIVCHCFRREGAVQHMPHDTEGYHLLLYCDYRCSLCIEFRLGNRPIRESALECRRDTAVDRSQHSVGFGSISRWVSV